jgi:type I restriction enzyme S subunit
MNADTLLNSFEILVEAPNGISQLRELILRLAISGKLVKQQESDGRGHDLVSAICNHKGIEPSKIRTAKSDFPRNWTMARIGELMHLEMGQSPESDSYNQRGDGLPFYQGKTDFGPFTPTPRFWCSSPTKVANAGDVLISVRAPVGPTNYVTEKSCIGRGLAALSPLGGMRTDFVLWWIRGYESQIAAMGTGTTFIAVSKKNLYPFEIAVPPLSEQERIVAKITELMALCDQLESKLHVRIRLAEKFARSAVSAI